MSDYGDNPGEDFDQAQVPQQPTEPSAHAIPTDQRTTTPYMTKYERARVLGTRAQHISMSAPVMTDVYKDNAAHPLEVAMQELREKKIPLKIRRYLPDGNWEEWKVSELL